MFNLFNIFKSKTRTGPLEVDSIDDELRNISTSIEKKIATKESGLVSSDIFLLIDTKNKDQKRTYLFFDPLKQSQVIASCSFLPCGIKDEVPVFQITCAVLGKHRGKKLGLSIAKKALIEFASGMQSKLPNGFIVEANVDPINIASLKIARTLLSNETIKFVLPMGTRNHNLFKKFTARDVLKLVQSAGRLEDNSHQEILFEHGMRIEDSNVDIIFIVKNDKIIYINDRPEHLIFLDQNNCEMFQGNVIHIEYVGKRGNDVIEIFVALDRIVVSEIFNNWTSRDQRLDEISKDIFRYFGDNKIKTLFSNTEMYIPEITFLFDLYKKSQKYFLVNSEQTQAYLVDRNGIKRNDVSTIQKEFWNIVDPYLEKVARVLHATMSPMMQLQNAYNLAGDCLGELQDHIANGIFCPGANPRETVMAYYCLCSMVRDARSDDDKQIVFSVRIMAGVLASKFSDRQTFTLLEKAICLFCEETLQEYFPTQSEDDVASIKRQASDIVFEITSSNGAMLARDQVAILIDNVCANIPERDTYKGGEKVLAILALTNITGYAIDQGDIDGANAYFASFKAAMKKYVEGQTESFSDYQNKAIRTIFRDYRQVVQELDEANKQLTTKLR